MNIRRSHRFVSSTVLDHNIRLIDLSSTSHCVIMAPRDRVIFSSVLFAASVAAMTLSMAAPEKNGQVSSRGASNLAPPMDYLEAFYACLEDPCDPISNPRGHIPVAVAENRLVIDLLQQRLATLQAAQAGFDEVDVYSYNDPRGLPIIRQSIASFFEERFLKQPTGSINPNHVAVGAGATNILSNIFFAMGSPGDVVLIPAPYYAAFDNDARTFADCRVVPVICQDPTKGPSVHDLENAKVEAEEAGLNVRFLLLTNPHNPLGVVYSPQVVKDAIGWARSHSMDTVMDEIYGCSVFGQKEEFKSILELYNNDLGNDLHLVWGFSKDFGASGFRMGVLYTQNEVLMAAIGNLIAFAWVPLPMQRIMADLLNDKHWVDSFLQHSCQRLKKSYTICTKVLDEMNVPYVKATSAMFLYLDLSDIIKTEQEEAIMSQIFFKRARMVLTPGTTQHDSQPGKFRICYAYVSPEVLKIGMERFRKVVTTIREKGGLRFSIQDDHHWEGVIV
mmetsp:Transcript_454/g.872  ORF Transcript_454/g.872 Transcript_454/m.872 type:complete len:503 (+) Transcript_454:13-1521(+)